MIRPKLFQSAKQQWPRAGPFVTRHFVERQQKPVRARETRRRRWHRTFSNSRCMQRDFRENRPRCARYVASDLSIRTINLMTTSQRVTILCIGHGKCQWYRVFRLFLTYLNTLFARRNALKWNLVTHLVLCKKNWWRTCAVLTRNYLQSAAYIIGDTKDSREITRPRFIRNHLDNYVSWGAGSYHNRPGLYDTWGEKKKEDTSFKAAKTMRSNGQWAWT